MLHGATSSVSSVLETDSRGERLMHHIYCR